MRDASIVRSYLARVGSVLVPFGCLKALESGDHLCDHTLEELKLLTGGPADDELTDADIAKPHHDRLERVGPYPSVQGPEQQQGAAQLSGIAPEGGTHLVELVVLSAGGLENFVQAQAERPVGVPAVGSLGS